MIYKEAYKLLKEGKMVRNDRMPINVCLKWFDSGETEISGPCFYHKQMIYPKTEFFGFGLSHISYTSSIKACYSVWIPEPDDIVANWSEVTEEEFENYEEVKGLL